jgi:hypothetical protein
MGSVGKLFAVQGDIPDGRRTIVPGIVEYVEHPRTVTLQVKAYTYHDRYQNTTHSIPHVPKDIQFPAAPILYFNPVEDVNIVQKLLEDLGFQDCTGRFHFYAEKRSTSINPINHQGIPKFEQDYVARVYVDQGIMDKIWSSEKQASGGL